MPAKGQQFSSDLLNLIFNGVDLPNVSSNLYVSLHTAVPDAAGNQTSNEATYGGYARVAVPRDSAGWTVLSGSASPVNPIIFPEATSGNETETYFAVGTEATGVGQILYFGPLTPVFISPGVILQLGVQTVITEL